MFVRCEEGLVAGESAAVLTVKTLLHREGRISQCDEGLSYDRPFGNLVSCHRSGTHASQKVRLSQLRWVIWQAFVLIYLP